MLQKKIKLSFKVCCYLHSQKVWASIIQNHDMFKKKLLLLTDQISLKIIFKTFFVDFGCDFSCSKSMIFSKAPTERYKKIWNNFCFIIVFQFASAQKLYLRSLTLFLLGRGAGDSAPPVTLLLITFYLLVLFFVKFSDFS